MKNRIKNWIILFSAILCLQCSEEESISLSPEIDATDVPVLDTRENLLSIDLNNFIGIHQSFKLQVNDTISVLFKDVVRPREDDPEADIIYSYSDDKAFVTFSNDGIMSFIANSEAYTLQGSIYKNTSVKQKDYQWLLAKRSNVTQDDDKVNRIILEDQDRSVLIEYIPKPNVNKMYEENNGVLPSDKRTKLSNTCEVVRAKINSNKNRQSVDFIKIFVYHYQETLSSSDVNYAKIHTRNSLKSVFGDLPSAKIQTYFNQSTDSNYRVNFYRFGNLIDDWRIYCLFTEKSQEGYKYLLLTKDGHDGVFGRGELGGPYSWAEVDGKGHTLPGHEIGHNFDATHTSARWDWRIGWFGWWRVDIMTPDRDNWFYYNTNSDQHEVESNKTRMREHYNSLTQ